MKAEYAGYAGRGFSKKKRRRVLLASLPHSSIKVGTTCCRKRVKIAEKQ